MKTFPLTVSSPDGDAFSGEAICLSLRGAAGDLAVMAGHIPFVTSVVPCTVRITLPSEEEITARVEGGILTVGQAGTVLLSGSFRRVEETEE